jgi:hypothetical protein
MTVREAHPTTASSLLWWAFRASQRVLRENLTHQIKADALLPILLGCSRLEHDYLQLKVATPFPGRVYLIEFVPSLIVISSSERTEFESINTRLLSGFLNATD